MSHFNSADDAMPVLSESFQLPSSPSSLRPACTLMALFVLGSSIYGIGVYAFTLLAEPIVNEHHWSRAILGSAVAAFWLSAPITLCAPSVGLRFGYRTLIFFGGLIEAAALIGVACSQMQWQLIGARFFMGVGKALVAVAIVLILAELYKKRSTVAIAIALSGWHFGGVWAVWMTHTALQYGIPWKSVAVTQAAILALVACGAVAFVPKQDRFRSSNDDVVSNETERDMSVHRIALFLLLACVYYSAYGALLAHITPLLLDADVSAESAAAAVGSVSLAAMVGVLASGLLTQLLQPGQFGAALFGLLTIVLIGLSTFQASSGPLLREALSLALGATIGAGDPCFLEFIRRAVRQQRYSRLFSIWYFICLISLFVGPSITGWTYDRLGSYRAIFAVFAALTSLAAFAYVFNARALYSPLATSRAAPT